LGSIDLRKKLHTALWGINRRWKRGPAGENHKNKGFDENAGDGQKGGPVNTVRKNIF
jgi:hypothetical protein